MLRSVHVLLHRQSGCLLNCLQWRSCLCFAFPCYCCSHHRSSVVSVVLIFNPALSALAPYSPILLSALLFTVVVPCLAQLFLVVARLPRSSDWSVVLTFNASLIAHAPSSPISLAALSLMMKLRCCWRCLVVACIAGPR